MTAQLGLPGLGGTAPLGALAAFGVLAATAESITGTPRDTGLSWTAGLLPHAVLTGWRGDLDKLVTALDADRQAWLASPVLTDRDDLILSTADVLRWGAVVAEKSLAEIRLWRSLISPDPLLTSKNGNVAYTPLKFTSGRQKFLRNVRDLAQATTRDHLHSALTDGTACDETLPSLRWDQRDGRIAALTGPLPTNDRQSRLVGAEWLAFRGLTVLPPIDRRHRFPSKELIWPVNDIDHPLDLARLRALMAEPESATDLRRGRAPIVIQDRSAYGHFSSSLVEPPQTASVWTAEIPAEERDRLRRRAYKALSEHGAVEDDNGHFIVDRDAAVEVLAELASTGGGHLIGIDRISEEYAIKPGTWRAYVARGQAPAPARRVGRTPLWDEREVWSWYWTRPLARDQRESTRLPSTAALEQAL